VGDNALGTAIQSAQSIAYGSLRQALLLGCGGAFP
jgi:hypothetical protein